MRRLDSYSNINIYKVIKIYKEKAHYFDVQIENNKKLILNII